MLRRITSVTLGGLLLLGCGAGPSTPVQTASLIARTSTPTATPATPTAMPTRTPAPTSISSPFPRLGDQTVKIAGHDLFVRCVGAGAPAIVLVHGLGGSHDVFTRMEPAIAQNNLVCSFDRVNSGRSGQDPERHTIADSATELEQFISVLGIPTPVVLVAASFGGEVALMYAGLHPEDVSGMVLVDATLPLEDELTAIDPHVTSIEQITAELNNNPERVDFYEAYAATNEVLPQLPDVPITYMRASHDDWPNWPEGLTRYDELLRAWIDDLPQGKLVDVDSGHDIQWEHPESVIRETEAVLVEIQ